MDPFLQNLFFRLQLFFSHSAHSVNSFFSFSGISNLQDSCYWWSIFYLFCNCCMKSERNSCNIIILLINQDYNWKSRLKRIKTKKFLQWCIFYRIAKNPDHEVKMWQNLVFLFLLPFIIYLSGFDLFRLSNFSKIPLMDSLDILSLGTP